MEMSRQWPLKELWDGIQNPRILDLGLSRVMINSLPQNGFTLWFPYLGWFITLKL